MFRRTVAWPSAHKCLEWAVSRRSFAALASRGARSQVDCSFTAFMGRNDPAAC